MSGLMAYAYGVGKTALLGFTEQVAMEVTAGHRPHRNITKLSPFLHDFAPCRP
jgi:hypothetical protein